MKALWTVTDFARFPAARSARWAVFAAVFALLSLQVTASDHWHGIDDTSACEVCLQAGHAPLPSTSAPLVVVIAKAPATVGGAVATAAAPQRVICNRGPPITS